MRILVRAKPGAKQEFIKKIGGETGLFQKEEVMQLTVAVKERAVDGAANRAIEKALAEYFNVAPSRVTIVSGHTSREKIVEIV